MYCTGVTVWKKYSGVAIFKKMLRNRRRWRKNVRKAFC